MMDGNNTEQRLKSLERMVLLGTALNKLESLEDYLCAVCEATCEVLQCSASSILTYEEESGTLKFISAPADQMERLHSIRVPLENSVAGEAYTGGVPVIVQNVNDDRLVFRAVDMETTFNTESILAAPIKYGDDIIGVLEALNKNDGQPFNSADIVQLGHLASLTGTAIFNRILFEEADVVERETENLGERRTELYELATREIREPLAVIMEQATALESRMRLDTIGYPKVEAIIENVKQLQATLNELTRAGNKDTDQPRFRRTPVDICDLIRQVCDSYQLQAESSKKQLRVDLQVADNLIVSGDEEKLGIALSNLLKNALTYTERGDMIMVGAIQQERFVKISVIDTGIGITANELEHVFERFYQVKAHEKYRRGGLGMGLPIAKTMIEMHGGEIWAESVVGRGSNFSFRLPL